MSPPIYKCEYCQMEWDNTLNAETCCLDLSTIITEYDIDEIPGDNLYFCDCGKIHENTQDLENCNHIFDE